MDYVAQQDMAQIFYTEIPPQLLGDMLHTFLAFRQRSGQKLAPL
jgi:hypothetical protein